RPKPLGKRSVGFISDKTLPIKTNNWLIVSANECIAVAYIVPFPLITATTILTTATMRFPKAARPEERFPFLINFIHFMLSPHRSHIFLLISVHVENLYIN